MSVRTDITDEASTAWQPVAPRLAAVPRAESATSRVVADERFQRWLSSVMDAPGVQVAARPLQPPVVRLEIETQAGALELVLEAAALPPALQMALALPDRHVACEVATALLEPLVERLQPVLQGARLVGFSQGGEAPAGFSFDLHGLRLLLCRADDSLVRHVAELLQDIPAAVVAWSSLQVRARLRLMVRHWRAAFIATLRPGDVALLGQGMHSQRLIVGTGFSMQADTELSPDHQVVQVSSDPQIEPDDGAAGHEASGAYVQDVELPVSFEIDTARVSLAELAGMRPGYIVELQAPVMEAMVRLVCHGQTIGQGQLVAVGDQLGVRIERMGIEHDAAAGH
jgi:type III secretion protein Q